ncbi:MAG: hypothetical protein V3W18_03300 [candidate division Zixibacteria bacterium]
MKDWLKKVFDPTLNLATFISILSAFVAVISLIRGCQNDSKYEKITYLQDALANQPRLELSDPLKYIDLKIEPRSDSLVISISDTIINFPLKCTFSGKFLIENRSQKIAHVRFIALSDSFSNSAVLRRIMRTEKDRNRLFTIDRSRETRFFNYMRLASSDTASTEIDIPLRHLYKDSLLVLHAYILYENDADALFDTYYLLQIHVKSPLIQARRFIENNQIGYEVKIAKSDLMIPLEQSISSYVYKIDERNEIAEWLNRQMEKINNLQE